MKTALVIRHFPDRKKSCLVLEQGNQCIVIGTLRNDYCEKLLKWFFYGSCGLYGEMRSLFDNLLESEKNNDDCAFKGENK